VDILARYGGDEFVVILPETTVRTACMVAERLRQSIRTHVFLKELGIHKQLTASIGVAGFPEHAETKQDLIRKADEAMYRAKAGGRDRIAVAEPATT
jgi:diguanylate cyclase (GGDEF)-like protein